VAGGVGALSSTDPHSHSLRACALERRLADSTASCLGYTLSIKAQPGTRSFGIERRPSQAHPQPRTKKAVVCQTSAANPVHGQIRWCGRR